MIFFITNIETFFNLPLFVRRVELHSFKKFFTENRRSINFKKAYFEIDQASENFIVEMSTKNTSETSKITQFHLEGICFNYGERKN